MSYEKFGHGEGLEEWSRKIGDLMDEMVNRNFVHFRTCGTWQPAVNVYETRASYFVCVELAGMQLADIEVHCLTAKRVTVNGVRPQPRPAAAAGPLSVHALEIDEGAFERIIDLPEPVDVDRVDALYDKGYLWVTLPRTKTV